MHAQQQHQRGGQFDGQRDAVEPALAEIIVQRRQLEDEALAAGAVDAAELGRWRASLNDSVAAQRFVACVNAVLESVRADTAATSTLL